MTLHSRRAGLDVRHGRAYRFGDEVVRRRVW